MDTAAQRILLETRGQSLTPAHLGEVVLLVANGKSVRIKDVAATSGGQPDPRKYAAVHPEIPMGRAGLRIHEKAYRPTA